MYRYTKSLQVFNLYTMVSIMVCQVLVIYINNTWHYLYIDILFVYIKTRKEIKIYSKQISRFMCKSLQEYLIWSVQQLFGKFGLFIMIRNSISGQKKVHKVFNK